MRRNNKLAGTWFCGNEASDYAKEKGYLDYATLAKAFDAVLNNNIMQLTSEIGYWDQTNGMIDNSDEIEELREKIEELENEKYEEYDTDEEPGEYENRCESIDIEIDKLNERIEELENEEDNSEIFQYYIISDAGAQILEDWTNEIVFYNEELDMYVWGVTHWGTAWSYVLTDIKLNCGDEAFN